MLYYLLLSHLVQCYWNDNVVPDYVVHYLLPLSSFNSIPSFLV